MKEYEERASELHEAMKQRHALDHQDFIRKSASDPQRGPKFSKDLLDLRRIEATLAKQGEYAEAQKVKLKADALESSEKERMQADRTQHISVAEVKFLHKQEQELNALKQRIQAGAEEQRKMRQLDLERLLQRYHNVKAELEALQNIERRQQVRKGSMSLTTSQAGRPSSARLSSSNSQPNSARRAPPSRVAA